MLTDEGEEAAIAVRAAQSAGRVITLESRVTAPVRARSRPSTVAVEFAVIDASAMIVPAKVDPDPRVAELPTFQKTLQWLAPPINETALADAVIKVLAAWKMNTELASPFNVTVPLSARASPA